MTPPAPNSVPRVLFFGPPKSGKSTLHEQVLRIATAAPGSDAASLPNVGPDTGLRRELTPHRVAVSNPSAGPLGGQFELCDCDSDAADHLLASPDAAVRAKARGLLADAVRSADALVLAVDAGATVEEVEGTFAQFRRLLDVLTEEREFGREVGGWPVFLTLTKCDTLARDGDSPAAWLRHVEARKAELHAHFAEAFADDIADDAGGAYHRFGSLGLSLTATCARVPPGPAFDLYADGSGGFGMIDLAGACLTAARDQHDRVASSRRRLRGTVVGVGGLLTAILAAVTVLATSGALSATDRLAERVRAYRSSEPPAGVRLADARLARHVKELRSLREADGYADLPAELRGFVEGRVREADDYRDYRAKFQPPRLGPAEVRTREQTEALAAELRGDLVPPAEYRPAWDDTEGARLWAKWRRDLELLTAAESQLHEWYRGLIRRANEALLTATPPDALWRSQVGELFAAAAREPFDPRAEIPGSVAVPLPRGRKLTYATAGRFDRVSLAKRDWDDTRARLRGLADLTDALGLTAGPDALDLPEPAAGGVGTRDLAATRLAAVRTAFPPRLVNEPSLAKATFPEWFEHTYPDTVRRAVEARLASVRETALRHLRLTIAQDAAETPDGLRQLLAAKSPAYADWDRLTQVLADLSTRTPNAPTPLAELAAFVALDRYAVDLPALTLRLPDDLLEQKARPGSLTLRVGAKEFAYAPDGEPQRENAATVYRLTPVGHTGKFALAPGDAVTAMQTVRSGPEEATLTWTSPRAGFYRFDLFEAAPTLSRAAGIDAAAGGVLLGVPPPGAWPRLPDLLRGGARR